MFIEEDLVKLEFQAKKTSKEIINEAKKLLPGSNYVGFSITQGMNTEKSWSIYKFTSLANKIISKNKIQFFIEKNKIDLIEKLKSSSISYFPELKSNYLVNLVTALSTRLDTAVSIDNGIMHMISLLKYLNGFI